MSSTTSAPPSASSPSFQERLDHWRSFGQSSRLLRPIHRLLGLAELAVFRLRYYSGLSLLALIGVILAVGLVTSAAFFAQAVDTVMMRRELDEYSRITQRPPFSARVFAASSTSVPLTLERAETLGGHVGDTLAGEVGLPVARMTLLADSGVMELRPPADSQYAGSRALEDVSVIYLQDVQDHIAVEGAPLDDGASGPRLEVWMHQSLAERLGVQLDDPFELHASSAEGNLPIVVRGFWQSLDPKDAYWTNDPDQTLRTKLLVRRNDYISHVEPYLAVKVRTATWHVVLDEHRAQPAQARQYKEGFERAAIIIQKYLPDARLTAPTVSLEKFVGRQTALTTLLLGFNVPALGFLIYFLVLTSAVIAYWQRRETAILLSRGIPRLSILNYTLIEGSLLFLIGCPLGLLFGVLVARLMGYAESFLSFSPRPPLPVSLHGLNLPLTLATLGVVLVAKLWTVAAASKETVVSQQREHARPSRGPFWYRNFLDLLLILPTLYAYQQLLNRGSLGALIQDRPEDLYQDPLLILVPALFIVVLSLLVMRLFPLFMALLDRAAAFLPSFTGYLALRQLGRQSQNYINPLLLVIVSLALGVYTLSMAASMDQWLVDRVYYRVGADLTFTPYLESEAISATPGGGADWIPPDDEFAALPGVVAATRVGDYPAEIRLATRSGGIEARFLGLDRVKFPQVAWFRNDFARESLGSLMNRLALVPDGILVSQRFLEENTLQIGDKVSILVIPDFGASVNTQFTVVGTYEYFPTVYEDTVTVVGNLEYIFSFFGVGMPHNIWLRLAPGVNGQAVREAIPTTGIEAVNVQDTQAILAEEQAQMERVGVFGTLTVSFLAAAAMAALGLLTYSYASLHERLFQFSVLRAVGLRRIQIVAQVVMEYAVLTLYGAAAGVFCGRLAAQLFVPLFRVSSSGPGTPLPPLLPVIADEQILPMALTFAGVMVVLEVLIISSAFYRRLFEALRLGHQA
ncbi:ABC transporter permease [Litorilinea aerophila]|uniref:ABC transporter permease n=1 Tax=Litorilinea aerophila TaxID=1204385 RepID=A0A540VGV5_9CHLR|nr:ABC transporter permease [Litorilinea aerophila]MCC9076384.1 ABC transporter permease [Litorilinea aerophila]